MHRANSLLTPLVEAARHDRLTLHHCSIEIAAHAAALLRRLNGAILIMSSSGSNDEGLWCFETWHPRDAAAQRLTPGSNSLVIDLLLLRIEEMLDAISINEWLDCAGSQLHLITDGTGLLLAAGDALLFDARSLAPLSSAATDATAILPFCPRGNWALLADCPLSLAAH